MSKLTVQNLIDIEEASKVIESYRERLEEIAYKYFSSKSSYYNNTLFFVKIENNTVYFEEVTSDYDGYYTDVVAAPLSFFLNFEEWNKEQERLKIEKEKQELEEKLKRQEEKRKKQEVNAQVKKEQLLKQLDNLYVKYPNLKSGS